MRSAVAILVLLSLQLLLLLPLPLGTPVGPAVVSAQQTTLALATVRYLSVEQGKYYAVNTGGVVYRARGPSGYIDTYWWDANASYIVFQAPYTGVVYLVMEDAQLGVLDTRSWFTPPTPPTPSATFTVTYPSPWSTTRTWQVPLSYTTAQQVSYYYNGTHVVYSVTNTYALTQTTYSGSVTADTLSLASPGVSYNAVVSLSTNVPFQHFNASSTGYAVVGTTTYYDRWACAYSDPYYYFYPLTYTNAEGVTGSSAYVYVMTGVYIVASLYPFNGNYWRVDLSVRFQSSFSASASRAVAKSGNTVVADNGNTVVVFDSLESLPLASAVVTLTTSLNCLGVAWANLTSAFGVASLAVRISGSYASWVNGTGLASGGNITHLYARTARLNTTHVEVDLAYAPQPQLGTGLTTVEVAADLEGYGEARAATQATLACAPPDTGYHLRLAPPTQLQPGDVLAPHLYDLHFDGVDDYIEVGHSPSYATTVHAVTMLYRALRDDHGKLVFSKGWWGNYRLLIESYSVFRITRRDATNFGWSAPSGTFWLQPRFIYYHLDEFNSNIRALFIDGAYYPVSYSINPQYPLCFECNNPLRIGGDPEGRGFAAGVLSFVSVHTRILSGSEIDAYYSQRVVNTTGLRLFLDPTFFDGSKYVDLSGWGNHAYPYNNPLRVPAERPFLWVVRGLGGGGLTLRFFPVGSVVVFSDGSSVVVAGPANPVGLVDTFLLGRTDVEYVLVDVPEFGSLTASVSADAVAHSRVGWSLTASVSSQSSVSSVFVSLEVVSNNSRTALCRTVVGRYAPAGYSASGSVSAVAASVDFPSGSSATARLHCVLASPLPAGSRVRAFACAEGGCRVAPIQAPQFVYWYDLTFSAPGRTTVGRTPSFSLATNATLQPVAKSLSGYIALRPPTQLQPGDVLAPHLYDWVFNGTGGYVLVPHPPTDSLWPNSDFIAVAVWLKPSSVSSQARLVAKESGAGDVLYALYVDPQTYGFVLASRGNVLASGGSATLGVWQHVLATWRRSPSAAGVYVNGSLVSSGTAYTGTIPSASYPLYVGSGPNLANPFFGRVASAQLFARYLTSTDASNAFAGVVNTTGLRHTTGLRLFLDPTFFDGTKYVDLSGYGNHGTPYGNVFRVPSERPFLWVVRGLGGGGLTLRFFPVGSVVVFSDGSSVVVAGPANPVGLVDTFLLGRTDVEYVLVPDPSRPGSADVLTRGDVGVLRFFPYLPTGGLYPYSEVEVVFDKLVLESFSTYPQNGTRLNAVGGSFEVCARLVHAYDGLAVTAGEVYLAGSAASFNGTCWRAVVRSPGYVSRSVYRVVSSAREGVWGVELVDAVPELVYTWDSIAVSLLSVDYASEEVSFDVRYAYDLSPLRSGYVRVVSGSWVREVVVSEGVVAVSLGDLPNATSSDLRPCAVYASDGAFVESGASACADFYVLDLGLFGGVRAKSSRPVAYLWSTDVLLALDVRADTYLLFRGSAPALFFLNGVRVAVEEVRGNLLVRCSGSELVVAFAVARPQTFLGPAPGGGVLAGFAENLTDPLSGLAAYVLVNETSALAVVSYGSVVLAYRELPPTNLPASLVLVYDYDSVTRVFTLYGLVVHGYGLSTRFYVFSVSAEVDYLPDLSAFVYNPSSGRLYTTKFAATYGLAVKLMVEGGLSVGVEGPFSVSTVVRVVYLSAPTVVELRGGSVVVYPGTGPALTLRGMRGFRLHLSVGPVAYPPILIPSDDYAVDVSLGYTLLVSVDPLNSVVAITTVQPVLPPAEFRPTPPPGLVLPPAAPVPGLGVPTGVDATVAVATFLSLGVAAYMVSRRLAVAVAVPSAASLLVGAATGGAHLLAGGAVGLAVAVALAWSSQE